MDMEKTIKVGVLIVEKGKSLLIKEWSEDKKDYRWNIIKGTFDDSTDKQFSDCAIREAKEEAGVEVSLSGFSNIIIKYGFSIRIYISFIASIVSGEPHTASKGKQSTRKEDITETKWFSKAELKELKKEDFINDVAFETVTRWINGETYPLSLLIEKIMKS
jgi:ADP-ribose pyrophosphatase YjhB (NUDIX family)